MIWRCDTAFSKVNNLHRSCVNTNPRHYVDVEELPVLEMCWDCFGSEEQLEQNGKSREIDKKIQGDRKAEEKIVKLLLLGEFTFVPLIHFRVYYNFCF